MRINAQAVFERAIVLMDEADQASGRADTPMTRPYKDRTPAILNLLGRECAQAIGQEELWQDVEDFSAPLALPEAMAGEVLPYGLAAHLFLEENPAMVAFFQRRYEELLARWARRAPAVREDIPLPYGGLEAQADGGWPNWP